MRERLTKPLVPWQNAVEQREIEGDPEAAPLICRYLDLADAALHTNRPCLFERQRHADADIPHMKHVAKLTRAESGRIGGKMKHPDQELASTICR